MILSELIRVGQEELEQDRLEEAEKSFAKAMLATRTEEDRQEVLRCLIKLAGKYLRQGKSDKPQLLYDYLAQLNVLERTRVLEWLARLHHQMNDKAIAEKLYTDIFEQRAKELGTENPETVGALKTAALFMQLQGKSAESLYVKAYEIAKEAGAQKRASTQTDTLFLLDALLSQDKSSPETVEVDKVPELTKESPRLNSQLQELTAAWEPFCAQITKTLIKLLQQNSSPAYRTIFAKLSLLLTDKKQIRKINIEQPFSAFSRRQECNNLDWTILKELAPVYAAFDGTAQTYPMEIGTIYACLRRAFELGPLHKDTLHSLYRLSHLYAQEFFGCYDLDFAAAGFRICMLAYRDNPEISQLMRINCRTNLAAVLVAKNELGSAKEILKEALQLADSSEEVSRPELISIMRSLGECTNQMGDYETAASVYERLRNFQEAVSRDSELFETFIHLIAIYRNAGNTSQMQSYQQRLYWELDWLKDANATREIVAAKSLELGLGELAEMMLQDILAHSNPYAPIAGRAMLTLIKIFESSGREDKVAELKSIRRK